MSRAIRDAIGERGRATIALSGGNTPKHGVRAAREGPKIDWSQGRRVLRRRARRARRPSDRINYRMVEGGAPRSRENRGRSRLPHARRVPPISPTPPREYEAARQEARPAEHGALLRPARPRRRRRRAHRVALPRPPRGRHHRSPRRRRARARGSSSRASRSTAPVIEAARHALVIRARQGEARAARARVGGLGQREGHPRAHRPRRARRDHLGDRSRRRRHGLSERYSAGSAGGTCGGPSGLPRKSSAASECFARSVTT